MSKIHFLGPVSKLLRRGAAFLWDAWTLSVEGSFYPDPLHLGPVFGMLYSSEGRAERNRDPFDKERP